MEPIKFYDLSTRQHVEVPVASVRRERVERPTKKGTQTRYQLVADHEGRRLFKFVNKADFDAFVA